MAKQRARDLQAQNDEEDMAANSFYKALSARQLGIGGSSGKSAVMSSRALQKVTELEQDREMITTVKRIGGRTFSLKEGVWIEKGLEKKIKQSKKIEYLSDEYFKLARSDKQLRKILALGEKVIFEWNGEIFRVESNNE